MDILSVFLEVLLLFLSSSWALSNDSDTTILGNASNPYILSFEQLAEEGLWNLRRFYPNTTMFIASVMPRTIGSSSDENDFRHIVLAAFNEKTIDIILEENSAIAPGLWFTPSIAPFPIFSIFRPWSWSDRRMILAEAFRILKKAGYEGNWMGVRIVRFKRDPLPEVRDDLFFAFWNASNIYTWVLVGMDTGIVHEKPIEPLEISELNLATSVPSMASTS